MFPTKRFEKKHVLVGITGCIAAYKSCELIRYLVSGGAKVRVMLTESAERFIGRLTLETLSQNPVNIRLFPENSFTGTHHIELADWAEAAIIAPATANIIGKTANGIGDDFVSTTLLAVHCPTVFAPAMNTHMWYHPAVQRNVKRLGELGYLICYPEEGFLAEGYAGMGRLARPDYLIQYLYRAAHPAPESLKGKTVLITGGATREYLDPVRMLTNRSSGRMGFALAWEAYARGARVILIHGPVTLTPPVDMEVYGITSAKEMYKLVKKNFSRADIFISAAAVADYRPANYSASKIKKVDQDLSLVLQRTEDILQEMSGRKKSHQALVGFAVETDRPEENARQKLSGKNLDLVVLNNPLEEGAAFDVETNRVTLLSRDEKVEIQLMSKLDVAYEIFDFLLRKQSL